MRGAFQTLGSPAARGLKGTGVRISLRTRPSLGTAFKLRCEALAASLEPGDRGRRKALSSVLVSSCFGLLCLQNSPAATTKTSDFGDGQGFAHLQVGRHTDGHMPHGEFPKGTAPQVPCAPPQSPVYPQLATSTSTWGWRSCVARSDAPRG